MAVDVDGTRVKSRWFKHAYPGADPSAQRDPIPDGRWQRGAVVGGLYLADTEETAWAEWYRHLAELGVPPNQQMPRDLWTWEVDVEAADLTTGAQLQRVGLAVPRPGRAGWLAYQHVGERLADEGWDGLVTVSAARPAQKVLCLFRAAGGSITGAQPLPPPLRVASPPAPPTGMTT